MSFWLLKTEPDEFSYDDLERKGLEPWNGVRNKAALKNISMISAGDGLFIYHTGKVKAIAGVGKASSGPYPDPAQDDSSLLIFDAVPLYRLNRPVTLKEVKAEPTMQSWELTRLPRLSVMPVSQEQWAWVHTVSSTVQGF